MYKLGLDFGKTICAIPVRPRGSGYAEEDPNFLNFPFVDDALESIMFLTAIFGEENVFIVSKAAEQSEKAIREWLERKKFWSLTGIRPDHIYFCRERADKGPICERLGITHFVDDRRQVLHFMPTVSLRIALSPNDGDPDEKPFINGPIIVLRNWLQVADLIAADVKAPSRRWAGI